MHRQGAMSPKRRTSLRRSRGRSKAAASEASGHLERSENWNGVRAGDPVIVSGLRMRGATWEFRAHIRNRRNETESIEVVGGRAGDRRLRSFEPDRIFPVTGSRRARQGSSRSPSDRPSLAEAPQLPLE
jgi:hypothetical protein